MLSALAKAKRTLPPIWAQADSVQIMTWTRQIRLIWALLSARDLIRLLPGDTANDTGTR